MKSWKSTNAPIQDKGNDKHIGIEDRLGAATRAVEAKIKQPGKDFQTEDEKGNGQRKSRRRKRSRR